MTWSLVDGRGDKVTPEARSAEDTETALTIRIVAVAAQVTPEARSAEDTETWLRHLYESQTRELHQRLDPRRILKRRWTRGWPGRRARSNVQYPPRLAPLG